MNFEEFVKEKRAIANKNNHVIFVEAVKERLRWAMKKIENVIERNDIPMTVEELCEEIESGKSSISYLLMKSFSKQNFYEKNQAEYIRQTYGIDLKKPGKSVYLNEDGSIVFKKSPTTTKSMDFEFILNGVITYVYAKYTEESGGAQDNQIKDAETFVKYASRYSGDVKFVCLIDGTYGKLQSKKLKDNGIMILTSDNFSTQM